MVVACHHKVYLTRQHNPERRHVEHIHLPVDCDPTIGVGLDNLNRRHVDGAPNA